VGILLNLKGSQYLVYEWLQPIVTLFCQRRLPLHRLWIALTRSLFNYHAYKTKNRWCSVDAHFQDWAGSLILLFLICKAANTSYMNGCNQSALRLHKMHSQNSLRLYWSSFSEWGSDCVVYSFAKKGRQYAHYGYFRPRHHSITMLTRLKIVDAQLRLIFWMGHGAWYYYFWVGRQPILSLWIAATNCHLGYPRYTAKHRWFSVEVHFHNGAVIVSFTVLPRKAARINIVDCSDNVSIQLLYLQDWKLLTLCWHSF